MGATARNVSATVRSETSLAAGGIAATEHRKRQSAWTWALPAAVAAIALFAFANFFGDTRVSEYSRHMPETGAVGTSGVVKHELPGGVDLRFRGNGTEARLLAFMRGSGPVTKDNWFEFDRLNFQTDSAVLRSDSMEQLSNVAAILKAYPTASAKIGGYTDNSGDRAANLRLSQMRAEAVRDELQKLGIDGKQLTAEGYGDQHPVADNNTAEGRAKNRRVAILVTSK